MVRQPRTPRKLIREGWMHMALGVAWVALLLWQVLGSSFPFVFGLVLIAIWIAEGVVGCLQILKGYQYKRKGFAPDAPIWRRRPGSPMYCPYCGTAIPGAGTSCVHCGASMEKWTH